LPLPQAHTLEQIRVDAPGDVLQRQLGFGRRTLTRTPRVHAADGRPPALAAFMSRTYSETYYRPSTGGGFDVAYDPSAGALTVTVKVYFNFENGNPSHADWRGTTRPDGTPYDSHEFAWNDEDKEDYASEFIDQIERHWSGRHAFRCIRMGWEALPLVHVNVEVDRVDAADGAHLEADVYKWPDNRYDRFYVDQPDVSNSEQLLGSGWLGVEPARSEGQFNESESDEAVGLPDRTKFTIDTSERSAYTQADADNPSPILFALGSYKVTSNELGPLRAFAETMAQPAMPDFQIMVIGHTSSDGSDSDNQLLSEKRARAVSGELVRGGVKSPPIVGAVGERGATEDAGWRRVDIIVGELTAMQTTILHEFGHVIGLGDEYPTPDGGRRDVGQAVRHSPLAQQLGVTSAPILASDNDAIMSVGEVVAPRHYITFLEALGDVTGTAGEWEVVSLREAVRRVP